MSTSALSHSTRIQKPRQAGLRRSTPISDRIAVIGAGLMGRTITTALIRDGVARPENLVVSDRVEGSARTLARELAVTAAPDNIAACSGADVILLCVKPQDVLGLLADLVLHGVFGRELLIISIAAKTTTEVIERVIGGQIPVVRAMPNSPCLIGQGMTAVTGGAFSTEANLALAHKMFSALGRCVTLDEKHFDVVTALSASGPAFIYLVLDALADGAVKCGLPRDVAIELAAQMTLGAADMVLQTKRHPAALKDDVTTPGGCTIAGLLTLEDGRMRSVFSRAVEATTLAVSGIGS
jgi:pyrroline-5-carboxylate reductase